MLRPVPVSSWFDRRNPEAEAAKLRELRGMMEASQAQAARRLGIEPKTYSNWELAKVRCQLPAIELMEIDVALRALRAALPQEQRQLDAPRLVALLVEEKLRALGDERKRAKKRA